MALPWLAALLILALAFLIRWPDAALSEDQFAQERLPERRDAVVQASREFNAASQRYRDYIGTHDLGALLAEFEKALPTTREEGAGSPAMANILELIEKVSEYVGVLGEYAEAGERYFEALSAFDAELMAWTRSLGAASEALRDDTFPVVEHLKLYPQPVGLRDDPPLVTAAEVMTQATTLENVRRELSGLTPGSEVAIPLGDLEQMVDGIWASGRSVEYIGSLHSDYERYLRTYDSAVGVAAASAGGGRGMSPAALALNVALGLVLLVGLGALLGGLRGRQG
jgi:hypothetical protein